MKAHHALMVVSAGGVAVALAVVQPDIDRDHDTRFWTAVIPANGMPVEHFDTLAQMASSADLVVVGRLTSLVPGREFGDEFDVVHYAWATLVVDQGLGSGTAPSSVTLEVQMPHGVAANGVKEYAARLPATPAIFFLRNKGQEALRAGLPAATVDREAPFYRLVVPHGLLLVSGDRVRTVPATEEEFLLALDGRSLAEVLDELQVAR